VELNNFGVKMKTTADLEREAYISGNIFLADLYAKMQDLEDEVYIGDTDE
jgi:hypothetical protein